MGDFGATPRDKWVCPNDRDLSLRAKLKKGWSVKTSAAPSYGGGGKQGPLSDGEQEAIVAVIRRAENIERVEQERVGRLVERLDNMRKNAMGNGSTQCVLCADEFGYLAASPLLCNDCAKAVCTKCGVDTCSALKEPLWLCKICAETRETWKKSGAWFYKGLPKYVLPERKAEPSKYGAPQDRPTEQPPARTYSTWLHNKGARGGDKEATDSSDDEVRGGARRAPAARRPTPDAADGAVLTAGGAVHYAAPPQAPEPPRPQPHHQVAPPRSPRHHADAQRHAPLEGGATVVPGRERPREFAMVAAAPPPPSAASQWHKPRREEEEPKGARGHSRRESQQGAGGRPRPSRGDDGTDQKTSPEESSSLEFCLLFDPHNQVLHCTVYRAKGLKATDLEGLADPYVRVHLLPIQSKTDKLRTRTVHKTLNPEFNETVSFYGISDYDIAQRTLRMTVVDEDPHCHEPVGEARLVLKKLRPHQPSHAQVYLHRPVRPEEGGEEEAAARGRILLSLSYSSEHEALLVGVARCVRLPGRDDRAFPDPFVKVQLKPNPLGRRFKTATKKKTLNPEYNEEFFFELSPHDMGKTTLEVTVWDKDYSKQEDYIGGLALNLQSKGDRLRHWLDVARNPNRRIERWHPLSNVVFID